MTDYADIIYKLYYKKIKFKFVEKIQLELKNRKKILKFLPGLKVQFLYESHRLLTHPS